MSGLGFRVFGFQFWSLCFLVIVLNGLQGGGCGVGAQGFKVSRVVYIFGCVYMRVI